MTEVNVVTEQKDEEQFADILLLLVAIERLVSLELAADVGQLFVDSLYLSLLTLAYLIYHKVNTER